MILIKNYDLTFPGGFSFEDSKTHGTRHADCFCNTVESLYPVYIYRRFRFSCLEHTVYIKGMVFLSCFKRVPVIPRFCILLPHLCIMDNRVVTLRGVFGSVAEWLERQA